MHRSGGASATAAVHAVSADLNVRPWRGGGYKVTGEVEADIDQVSVISLETFRSTVRYPVERYFLPHGGGDSEEDIDAIDGGVIDLGEVAAETLGLELDPYPRKPGEAFARAEEGGEDPALAKVSPLCRAEKTGQKRGHDLTHSRPDCARISGLFRAGKALFCSALTVPGGGR